MYVITGATGNTGRPLTLVLLRAGKKVRVISRSAEKAKDLTERGAELFVGDTSSVDVLTKAFTGATAVYAMIPFDPVAADYTVHQRQHADAIAAAVRKSGVKFVVSLSSVGAHLEKDSGVVFGLRVMEQQLNAIAGLNTLHLRPTYFMENTFGMMDVIKTMGVMGSPVRGDLRMNMIATGDIAAYAAKRLLALDFKGHTVQYLLGQRDLTYREVATVFGKALGKPDLKYVEFPYEAFAQGMLSMGMSKSLVDNMNIFIQAMNDEKVLADARRDAESTTPTSIEEFSNMFAAVYRMK